MRLDDNQIELYSRQIILRELGGTGQQRLLEARCLAFGGGPALESALSYLAGAGVGAIDVVAAAEPAARPLGLAPLAERSPDLRLRTLPSADGSLEDYDVCLVCEDGASAGELLRATSGRPRRGSIGIACEEDGALRLLLVPRHGGCPACVACKPGRVGSRSSPADAHPPEASALALAGTMAALATCRWLAGIEAGAAAAGDTPSAQAPERVAERARALRLTLGAVLWEESAVARAARCPRGCPPPGRAL